VKADVLDRAPPSAHKLVDLSSVAERMVKVICGTREINDTYVDVSVAQVRTDLAETLKIPSGAAAIINGKSVAKSAEASTLVAPGQLEFVQIAAEKG
jgi:hypothetical protein